MQAVLRRLYQRRIAVVVYGASGAYLGGRLAMDKWYPTQWAEWWRDKEPDHELSEADKAMVQREWEKLGGERRITVLPHSYPNEPFTVAGQVLLLPHRMTEAGRREGRELLDAKRTTVQRAVKLARWEPGVPLPLTAEQARVLTKVELLHLRHDLWKAEHRRMFGAWGAAAFLSLVFRRNVLAVLAFGVLNRIVYYRSGKFIYKQLTPEERKTLLAEYELEYQMRGGKWADLFTPKQLLSARIELLATLVQADKMDKK